MQTKIVFQDSLITIFIGFLISATTFLIGGVDRAVTSMGIFIVSDIVTGVAAAFYTGTASSRVMFWGLVRKGCLLILLIIAHHTDVVLGNGDGFMRYAMIMFIIGVEGLSILENLGKLNLPIPAFFINALSRLKGKTVVETRVVTEYHDPELRDKSRNKRKGDK